MSNVPDYKQSMAYPSAPSGDQEGYGAVPSGAPPPPYPVVNTYQGQAPSQYPVAQPAYPPMMPPAQPYGQQVPASGAGYIQAPYQAGGSAYGAGGGTPYGGGYGESTGDVIQYNPENGREDDGSTPWIGSSFSDKKIRQQFIKKVYLLLMSQLFFTFGVVCLFFFCHDIKHWVQNNSWFYWCSYAVFLVTYITLVCCDGVRRRWPANIICLVIFTAAFSYMAATITSFYDTQSVLIALGITAAVCLAISLFAIQTKIDFTMCSGLIFALCAVLFFFGIACMITYLVSGPNYIMHCVYGGLAAVVFSMFLVFDTQMVVGGQKRRYQLSPEEYIYGALQLYVDVVNLFIIILGLVGGKRT